MEKRMMLGLIAMLIGAAGCTTTATGDGTMLDGTMVALRDGTVYKFQIERSSGSGAMRATSLSTGEVFTGQYSAKLTSSASTITSTERRTTLSSTTRMGAEGIGFLRNERGTVIEVVLDIVAGVRPTGNGEGRDNSGNRYQIQF